MFARLAVAAAALALLPSHSPLAVVEYPIPRPGNFPHDPAVGADGIVWYTDQTNSYIGRLDPATGRITDYPTPTPSSGPHGIVVAPDGGVWYTNGKIVEYDLPEGARHPHTPLVVGRKVWFTDANSNSYGWLDPATGASAVFIAPTPASIPYGIRAAADGSLWIAQLGTNKLGHVDPATGNMTEFSLPDAGARPRRLALGADGTVWYTDNARGYLGALDPKTGQRVWSLALPAPARCGNGRRRGRAGRSPTASPSPPMAASGTMKRAPTPWWRSTRRRRRWKPSPSPRAPAWCGTW